MSNALAPLRQEDVTEIQKVYPDMQELIVKQFFYRAGGGIAAKKELLYFQLDQKLKEGFGIETDFVDRELRAQTMADMKMPENAFFIMMKAIITSNDPRKKPVSAYAVVTAANMKGNRYPIELCETRAELRAIRKLTRCGFKIQEEPEDIPEEAPTAIITAIDEETRNNFTRLQILVRQSGLDRDDKLDLCSSVAGRRVKSSKELSGYEVLLAIEKLENIQKRGIHKPITQAETKKAISKWDGQPTPPPPPVVEEEVQEADFEEVPEVVVDATDTDFEDFIKHQEVEKQAAELVKKQQGPERDRLLQAIKKGMFELGWLQVDQNDFWEFMSVQKGRTLEKEEDCNTHELKQLLDYLTKRLAKEQENGKGKETNSSAG